MEDLGDSIGQQQQLQLPPPSPLEQRQWRREAQRRVRLALLAAQDAMQAFDEASRSGQGMVQAAADQLLQLYYLPSRPLGSLEATVPGLREAAAAKLRNQQQASLELLRRRCQDMEDAVEALHAAAASVSPTPGDTTATESRSASPAPGEWLRDSPVFNTLPARTWSSVLQQLADMYRQECSARRRLSCGVEGAVHRAQKPQGSAPAPGAAQLEDELRVYLVAWVSKPYLDSAKADLMVALLKEDMSGF